jgi:hypothetical protein
MTGVRNPPPPRSASFTAQRLNQTGTTVNDTVAPETPATIESRLDILGEDLGWTIDPRSPHFATEAASRDVELKLLI